MKSQPLPKPQIIEILPENKDVSIRKQREFDLYCIWKSLPPIIISPNKETVDECLDRLRIDDPMIRELANIRTQGQFAEKYGVSQDVLPDWNKLIVKRDTLADIRVWAKSLSKNVMMSMYQNAMSNDVKGYKDRENFLKVIEGWSEKLDLKHEVGDTLADLLRAGLAQRNGNTDEQFAE